MHGIYGDILRAAEQATEGFEKTQELLEYPEVQADKNYYLSVLATYNAQNAIRDKLTALKAALREEDELSALLTEATDEEREAIYEEMSSLKRRAASLSAALADAIGCEHTVERAYCRMKLTAGSIKIGAQFFALIKDYLLSRGAKIEDEQSDGNVISFFAEGEDIITRLSPLTGAHKVYLSGAQSEELMFAVTGAAVFETVSESDLKVDVFHASGAGGQNVNKVETAVRVTHIPTGVTVTCQDERSQLQNRKRAYAAIEKRLREKSERAEKQRMEADIYAQYQRNNTPIFFDAKNATMTDKRLEGFNAVPFPITDFASYMFRLISL